jgi:hypothetical protein
MTVRSPVGDALLDTQVDSASDVMLDMREIRGNREEAVPIEGGMEVAAAIRKEACLLTLIHSQDSVLANNSPKDLLVAHAKRIRSIQQKQIPLVAFPVSAWVLHKPAPALHRVEHRLLHHSTKTLKGSQLPTEKDMRFTLKE